MKVICPNCKSLLTISTQEDISEKLLTCPRCKYKAKVSVYLQEMAKIHPACSNDSTLLSPGIIQQMDRTVGVLYVDGKGYQLHKGKNTIGRKATSSSAEIQIESGDRFMSRSHACITVKDGMSGLEHQLEALNPKNPIKINGNILENDDLIVLQWGDNLTFGKTDIVFERPNYGEEATIYENNH